MAKPTELPEWATGAGTTLEPSAGEKATGWEVGNKPPARKMNWLFNILYQWMEYLDDTIPFHKYAAIADSTTIVNSVTTEQTFDNNFDIPANTLQVGDTIRIHAVIETVAVTGTRTAQLKLYLDANQFCTIPLGTISSTEDAFLIDAWLTVRGVGATGAVVSAVRIDVINMTSKAITASKGEVALDSSVDTTADLTASITWQWSATGGGDSVKMTQMSVEVAPAGST